MSLAVNSTARWARTVTDRGLRVARSTPLACLAALSVLVAGLATETLFRTSANDSALVQSLSYGLPALREGRPLAFLGGALLVPAPALYPVVAMLLGLAVGFVERRVGSVRAAAVLIGTHLTGTLGAAGVLAAGQSVHWPWARALALQTDFGMSAGAVGALAAGTALASRVWRARVRWIVGGYLAVMMLRSGLLWDLEHLIGFAAGLVVGPLLRSRLDTLKPARSAGVPRLTRIRGVVALMVLLVPAGGVVMAVYPGIGGIGGLGRQQLPGPHAVTAGLIQVGIALVISKALRRGLPGAWWAAVVFCVVPLGRILVRGLALPEVTGRIGDLVAWALLLGALMVYRRCWPRRLPAIVLRRHLPRLAVATAAFVGLWWLVLMLVGLKLGVPGAGRGREVLARTIFGAGLARPDSWLARFLIDLSGWLWAATLVALLAPIVLCHTDWRRRTNAAAQPQLVALLRAHGGGSLGWQRTWPGLVGWTTKTGDVAISYRIVSGVAIVLGDPVGPVDRWPAAVAEFRRFCLNAGWTPCWYAVTPAFAQHGGAGWHLIQIGEDAVLNLAELEFRGKAWQDVRTARNHAVKDGIRMQAVILADESPQVLAQIDEVSRGWARSKPLPEMGFTLGTIAHAHDRQMRTHIAVDEAGTVHGVTTWLPVHADGRVIGWTLDVMRRKIGGFRPVIEFLIAESALAFRAEGFATLSLSVAPLARCAARTGGERPGCRLDALLDRISRMLEPAYGFRSLLDFKCKFRPDFTPVYLGYGAEVELSEISVAIGRAYLPKLTAGQICRTLRSFLLARRRRRSDKVVLHEVVLHEVVLHEAVLHQTVPDQVACGRTMPRSGTKSITGSVKISGGVSISGSC